MLEKNSFFLFKDEKPVEAEKEKEASEAEKEKEKKEKEPDFEILQNPFRVMKPQVREREKL